MGFRLSKWQHILSFFSFFLKQWLMRLVHSEFSMIPTDCWTGLDNETFNLLQNTEDVINV